MKIKLGAALAVGDAIGNLSSVKVPVGLSLKLRALAREVDTLAKDYEAERVKALKEHAETDDAGELVVGDNNAATFAGDEQRDAFLKANVELLDAMIDVKTTLQAKDFGTAEIEPALVLAIGDILREG